MDIRRRISATFKDLPGGQVLGPTFDYTHRLLDHTLAEESDVPPPLTAPSRRRRVSLGRRSAGRRRLDRRRRRACDGEVGDLTREPLSFPAGRDLRLQNLARGDEGFLLALGLFDPARLRPQPSLRRRNPLRRGRGRVLRRGCRLCRAARHGRRDRMPDGQPVHRQRHRGAALHARLRPVVRPERAQVDGDGFGRPRLARARNWARKPAARRRTPNSCSAIPTMCRRPASSST